MGQEDRTVTSAGGSKAQPCQDTETAHALLDAQDTETAHALLGWLKVPDGHPQGGGDIDTRTARAILRLLDGDTDTSDSAPGAVQ